MDSDMYEITIDTDIDYALDFDIPTDIQISDVTYGSSDNILSFELSDSDLISLDFADGSFDVDINDEEIEIISLDLE